MARDAGLSHEGAPGDRTDRTPQPAHAGHGVPAVDGPLPAPSVPMPGDRWVACVGPSPSSLHVVQAAARGAQSLGAAWAALHIRPARMSGGNLDATTAAHLRFAEAHGGEVRIVEADEAAEAVLQFAREWKATHIVIGQSRKALRIPWRKGTLVDRVLDQAGDIDVHVVHRSGAAVSAVGTAHEHPRSWSWILPTTTLLLVATVLCQAFHGVRQPDVPRILVYLLAVTITASTQGRVAAIVASVGAVLSFNFFYTEPRFTFEVHDPQYLLTFGVMLAISLLVGGLTASARGHAEASRARERRTDSLYRLSRRLSATSGKQHIVAVAAEHLTTALHGSVCAWTPDSTGVLQPEMPVPADVAAEGRLGVLLDWVRRNDRMAGSGTDVMRQARVLALPLSSPEGVAGVVGVARDVGQGALSPDDRRHLETLVAQVGMALMRDRQSERVHQALAQSEAERTRSTLLSAISHDFRTPLAAIAGAATSLLIPRGAIPAGEVSDLLASIVDSANRLARLVDNLLHLTRLELPGPGLRREWHVIQDLVGCALRTAGPALGSRNIDVLIDGHTPLVHVDGTLLECALVNLLENAAKFSPDAAPIEVRARPSGDTVLLEVADRGPGVPDAERLRVFERFHQGTAATGSSYGGTGLGLAICRAVATSHGGTCWVEDREGGGARFVIALPRSEEPPRDPIEED